MITVQKTVTLMRKEKVSEFKTLNFAVLGDSSTRKIGGSISAENAMLVNAEELRSYLPNIIGVSPSAPEWGKALDMYVRSIAVPVEANGLDLEIGFNFDHTDYDRKAAWDALAKEAKIDPTDEKKVVDYIQTAINRNYWWKYGQPITPADYFLWRYTQNHRKVANSMADADKSLHISFYIVDQDDVKAERSKAFKLKNQANGLYFKLSSDMAKVKAVLFAGGKGMNVISARDNDDILMALDSFREQEPAKFIELASNTDAIAESAFVQEAVARGVLNKLPNTNLITDSSTGEPLGGNVEEVIVFLRKEENLKQLNEIKGRMARKTI